MPEIGFGSYGSGARYTDNTPVYSDGIPLHGGRVCSDGNNRAGIVALQMYTGGAGGNVTAYGQLGSAVTNQYLFGDPGFALDVGFLGTNLWIVAGGTARINYVRVSGASLRFPGGGAGVTYDSVGGSYSGTIAGAYRYILPPTAPTISSVTPNSDGTSATISITSPGDNGDSPLLGHRLQRAVDPGFTSGLATIDVSIGSSPVMTGLTPGTVYYYRATTRNALTDAGSVLGGAWSAVFAAYQPDPTGMGRRFNSSSGIFETADAKRFNSGTGVWEPADGRRWNAGTATWDPLGQ